MRNWRESLRSRSMRNLVLGICVLDAAGILAVQAKLSEDPPMDQPFIPSVAPVTAAAADPASFLSTPLPSPVLAKADDLPAPVVVEAVAMPVVERQPALTVPEAPAKLPKVAAGRTAKRFVAAPAGLAGPETRASSTSFSTAFSSPMPLLASVTEVAAPSDPMIPAVTEGLLPVSTGDAPVTSDGTSPDAEQELPALGPVHPSGDRSAVQLPPAQSSDQRPVLDGPTLENPFPALPST